MVYTMRLFLVVLARDKRHIGEKIDELKNLDVPYIIVCGEPTRTSGVVYRTPRGKYDAINFAAELIPEDADIVAFNDVDTRITCNFRDMLRHFKDKKVAIVFASERVKEGPQVLFLRMLNPIRKRIPLASSGELMMVRRDILPALLPLKPCKAEDTYMMFKALELGYKAVFCEECHAETVRTKRIEKETPYRRKTVAGIYQALSYAKPPWLVRIFYMFLPFASVLFLVLGRKGYYWTKGILLGFLDYARGDRSGSWKTEYMD